MPTGYDRPKFTPAQREAILELGTRGAGGQFNQQALGELFAMALVEVRSADRRLTLTNSGRLVYEHLKSGDKPAAWQAPRHFAFQSASFRQIRT